MKLNLGLSLSRLAKDISKGKPIKPGKYIWVNASKSIKFPKK